MPRLDLLLEFSISFVLLPAVVTTVVTLQSAVLILEDSPIFTFGKTKEIDKRNRGFVPLEDFLYDLFCLVSAKEAWIMTNQAQREGKCEIGYKFISIVNSLLLRWVDVPITMPLLT